MDSHKVEYFLEKLENDFKKYLNLLNKESYILFLDCMGHLDDREDKTVANYWCHEYINRMYNVVCAYLEHRNLNTYLITFQNKFKEFKAEGDLLKYAMYPIDFGEYEHELAILVEWRSLLAPFNLFGATEEKEITRRTSKLISILESTNNIIKVTNTKIIKDDDINNLMRKVSNWFFDGVYSFSEGYFVHKFKSYRPDILIKELGAAVEYKLIRLDKEIGLKLDELIIDANRYTENPRNRICIAVFCLTKKVTRSRKEIKEDWIKMKFPNNWKLIIIPDLAM